MKKPYEIEADVRKLLQILDRNGISELVDRLRYVVTKDEHLQMEYYISNLMLSPPKYGPGKIKNIKVLGVPIIIGVDV